MAGWVFRQSRFDIGKNLRERVHIQASTRFNERAVVLFFQPIHTYLYIAVLRESDKSECLCSEPFPGIKAPLIGDQHHARNFESAYFPCGAVIHPEGNFLVAVGLFFGARKKAASIEGNNWAELRERLRSTLQQFWIDSNAPAGLHDGG